MVEVEDNGIPTSSNSMLNWSVSWRWLWAHSMTTFSFFYNLRAQSITLCTERLSSSPHTILCTPPSIGWGCRGGRSVNAFIHMMRHGLSLDEAYPLRTVLGHDFCKLKEKPVHTIITSWTQTSYGQRGLMARVASGDCGSFSSYR
jgi:hypothetical protein